MPLPKRQVEPVHVSRGTVPERLNVPCELEAVTNGTLANCVRQLSSLSKHAEDIFGELTRDASDIAERTNVLQARIDRLAVKVTQLDSNVEEVSMQDIQMRKPFRSSRAFDQQIFSRATMPSAMMETYARCDRPPPLERLNEFRDDGRDARKFYTDPDYFFELWRREMIQDTERIQHDRGKRARGGRSTDPGRAARRVRMPTSTRERQRDNAVARGEHIMQQQQQNHHNNISVTTLNESVDSPYGSAPSRPSSIEINNYHAPNRITSNGHVPVDGAGVVSPEAIYSPRRNRPTHPPPAPPQASFPDTPTRSSLPPPPPPPAPDASALDIHLHRMHAAIGMMSETSSPPPPPPPPPASPPPTVSGAAHATPPPVSHAAPPPPPPDPRSDLLKAIRDGITLRKVEQRQGGSRYDTYRAGGLHDVASILQRRIAVELSDSDSDRSDDDDNDDWGESMA